MKDARPRIYKMENKSNHGVKRKKPDSSKLTLTEFAKNRIGKSRLLFPLSCICDPEEPRFAWSPVTPEHQVELGIFSQEDSPEGNIKKEHVKKEDLLQTYGKCCFCESMVWVEMAIVHCYQIAQMNADGLKQLPKLTDKEEETIPSQVEKIACLAKKR